MKSIIKYLNRFLVAVAACLLLAGSANAQRPSRGAAPGSVHSSVRPGRGVGPGYVLRRPARAYVPRHVYPGFYHGYYGPYFHYYSPWIGVRLRVLPWGYISFNFGPDLFFYYNGIFYRRIEDQYEVVAPPVGAEVPGLPSGATEIRINGELFYEKNGVYYKEVVKDDNKRAYVVAGKDGELNTDEAVLPREGDIVNDLPADSRLVVINGQEYYLAPNGFYYQEIEEGDHAVYKVVGSASDSKEK